ncbi:MAG: hypothetical protein KKB37_08295 [Alphaproteobacteria bacterium]|nr:hypothetical protein [Alphaproteobacteria bacterium]
MRRFELLTAVVAGVMTLMAGFVLAKPETPQYVGSEACIGCHAKYSADWKQSHHALAWNKPDDKHVLGNFADAEFKSPDLSAKFRKNGSQFIIETLGRNGKTQEFKVHSTAGVAPLQQYLLEVEKGRLQSFDLAWDAVKNKWYHLYPDQKLDVSDGLHWTGPYKNWNARCAECHATGFQKAYNVRDRKYESRQAEMGVGCEACHGPGERHVAWAGKGPSSRATTGQGASDKGFTIDLSEAGAEREIQVCAACHSRREALTDRSPLPGTAFHDSYQLGLLRPELYHADGSILEEVYVYGSFLQSKMYARGVRCSDCHDPHSAGLKADGNAVCTQCHSSAGNMRFPTLKKAEYDSPAHHFHQSDSRGAKCVSCHMIERVYMGIDGRRDHSFRVPRPDLSEKTGAPDACTDCHEKRSPAWAADEIAKRHPAGQRDPNHFSVAFARARENPAAQMSALFAIANDRQNAGIIRATALDFLRSLTTPEVANRSAALLGDTNPMVRSAALRLQRGGRLADVVPRILPLLEDRYKSVRINAALVLSSMPIAHLPTKTATAFRAAQREWQSSLMSRADFPETHLQLGGFGLTVRDLRAAEGGFREAVRQDPQLVDAWRMLVEIDLARRNVAGAARTLAEALAANPENTTLMSMSERIGLSEKRPEPRPQ